jgi:uncharacterized membrane protein YdfJ with MMPL/SSD domain
VAALLTHAGGRRCSGVASSVGARQSPGLGVGILLDATIVRALLVPALVSLFGRWNWWFPRPVARMLRVAPRARPAIETAGR